MSDDSTTPAPTPKRTPAGAYRQLDAWRRVFKLGGWIYFGLHAWVTAAVYGASGFLAALATFIAVGLGDLVWTILWWRDPAQTGPGYAALIATCLIFGYGAIRRWTDRYLVRLTIAALDFPPDIRSGGEPIDDRPGSITGKQP